MNPPSSAPVYVDLRPPTARMVKSVRQFKPMDMSIFDAISSRASVERAFLEELLIERLGEELSYPGGNQLKPSLVHWPVYLSLPLNLKGLL